MRARATAAALLAAALLLTVPPGGARAAPDRRHPSVGYVCAAGGRRGTTFEVLVGGQNLRTAQRVHVSGEGVHASVVRFEGVAGRLKPEQLRELRRRLQAVVRARTAGLAGATSRGRPRRNRPRREAAGNEGKETAELPDHPLLRHLDELSLVEIRKVASAFFDPAARQNASAQIAETLRVRVTIDADAAPGDRELRVGTRTGLSNPVVFQVGLLPEVSEIEPNDFDGPHQPPVTLPAVLNGQVSFQDVDRFRFRARAGQRLVVETEARHLVPYLADAVPGWFQAIVSVFDDAGREIACADDWRFDPDPVLVLDVPRDGDYVLEIRDAVDRGREDFVYRIRVGEGPFISRVFPLGARAGTAASIAVEGVHLPWDAVLLDTSPGRGRIRTAVWDAGGTLTNRVTYAVDDLPERLEDEAGEGPAPVDLPRIVNGRIDRPGDVDAFRIEGRGGEEVVAEVFARRLGSPLDSYLAATDARGRPLGANDDTPDPTAGLVTHQADSFLRLRLPPDGVAIVRLSDARGHGGPAHAYRLHLRPPRPRFDVLVTPSGLSAPAGGIVPLTVHVVRRDGFDGPVEVALRGAPAGYRLDGAVVPAGRDRMRMTLAVPATPLGEPLALRVEGRARIGGATASRPAIPADDRMQAFGLRHLVPANALLVDVLRPRFRTPPLSVEGATPLRLPAGGSATVRIRAPGLPAVDRLDFELDDPPAGVRVRESRTVPGGLLLVLEAAPGTTAGRDNLIVDVYATVEAGRGRGGEGKEKRAATRRVHVATLPAVVVEIGGE